MKRTCILILLSVLLTLVLTGCGTIISFVDEDPYLTPGSPEYARYTQELIGTWEVTAMEQFGENSLGDIYDRITVTISLDPMAFVMEFYPRQAIIDRKTEDWAAKDPTFRVDSYKRVIAWDEWAPGEKGLYDQDFISFPYGKPSTDLVITGAGTSFPTFVGWETMMTQINGLHYLPERFLVEFIHGDSMRLFSYEEQGILHWNRDHLNTDILLKRVR